GWLSSCLVSGNSSGGLRPEKFPRLGRCGPCAVPWQRDSAAHRIRERLRVAAYLLPLPSLECAQTASNKDRRREWCRETEPPTTTSRRLRHRWRTRSRLREFVHLCSPQCDHACATDAASWST